MNISEIVNYVNRTPHNTNPNVIASMVQGANEQAVYESVEKLKQDGGVGYIEKKVIALRDEMFDDIAGNDSFTDNGMQYIRIGDYIDPYTISEVVFAANGEKYTIPSQNMGVLEEADGFSILADSSFIGGDGLVRGIFCLNENNSHDSLGGTYVLAFNTETGITQITVETVHTIDPKYLGGVVLPVLTLSVDTIVAAYNSESLSADVNEREATEIFYALNCGMPLVVKNEVAEGVLDIAAVSVLNYTGAEFSGEFMGVKFTITSIVNGNPTIRFTPIESE